MSDTEAKPNPKPETNEPGAPKVGFIVHYLHNGTKIGAIVTRVHPDGTVDLLGFPPGTTGFPFSTVERGETEGTWCWQER